MFLVFSLIAIIELGGLLIMGFKLFEMNDAMQKTIDQQKRIIALSLADKAKLTEELKESREKIVKFADNLDRIKNELTKVSTANPNSPSSIYDIAIGHDPFQGSKDAAVKIVEFVDFQCPFCAKFHPRLMKAIEPYKDKVQYLIKHYPLPSHPFAPGAAKACFAAAEQGKYWEMVEALFIHHAELNEDKFYELAKQIGLDVKKFKKDFKEKDTLWNSYIAEDKAEFQRVGMTGTPTYFINGKRIEERDVDALKAVIEKELSR